VLAGGGAGFWVDTAPPGVDTASMAPARALHGIGPARWRGQSASRADTASSRAGRRWVARSGAGHSMDGPARALHGIGPARRRGQSASMAGHGIDGAGPGASRHRPSSMAWTPRLEGWTQRRWAGHGAFVIAQPVQKESASTQNDGSRQEQGPQRGEEASGSKAQIPAPSSKSSCRTWA
jgi:hypothetical protein